MNKNQEELKKVESAPELKKEKKEESGSVTFKFNKKTVKYFTEAIAFLLLLYWALNNTDKVSSVFGTVFGVIEPFLIGFAIAFVVNVLLRPLEKLWDKLDKKKKKLSLKLKRPVCLLLSTIIMFGVVFALIFMVIPEFTNTFQTIAKSVPQYLSQIEKWLDVVINFADNYGINLPEFSFNAEKIMDVAGKFINNSGIVDKTLNFTGTVVTGIVNLVIALAFSVYLLSQKEKLSTNVKRTLFAFFPEKKVTRLLNIIELTDQTFTNFVSGQLMEAVIIGLLCFIGMLIFGMPYAAVISVLVGFTALIPVFGAFIGTAIGAFLILFVSPMKAIWFVVFIVILQQLEGNLIYPKVVGKSVGLPGIWVLTAVSIGGSLFGVIGILVSVPLCAVLYTLLRRAVNLIEKSRKSDK